jgi:hypothetical protein
MYPFVLLFDLEGNEGFGECPGSALHGQLFLLQLFLRKYMVFDPRCTERPTRMTLTAVDVQFATVEISSQGRARVLPSQLGACAMIGVRGRMTLAQPSIETSPHSTGVKHALFMTIESITSLVSAVFAVLLWSTDDVLSSPVMSSDTRTRLNEVTSGGPAAVRSYDFALTK